MAFTSSLIEHGTAGGLRYALYTWTATAVTSGNIVTMFGKLKFTSLANKTEQRGTVDDTTTDGTVALTNLTSGDTGYVLVYSL